MTKEIPLTQGKVTLVDDHRFEYLNQWKWHAFHDKNRWYALRRGPRPKAKMILMHRVITNAPDGFEVDHKDRDGLNNTDDNLRLATESQNQANRTALKNNRCGFKGVVYYARRNVYRARIKMLGKTHHLGYFKTPEEAARAYDAKARELFGEFAGTNFQ